MNKLYEEAAEALNGEALAHADDPAFGGEDATGFGGEGEGTGMLGLLAEIRDLLKELIGGEPAAAPEGGEGFKLPDNASEIDLTTGEPEGEPDEEDELPLPTEGEEGEGLDDGRVDLGAEDQEGVEGDEDEEDDRE